MLLGIIIVDYLPSITTGAFVISINEKIRNPKICKNDMNAFAIRIFFSKTE